MVKKSLNIIAPDTSVSSSEGNNMIKSLIVNMIWHFVTLTVRVQCLKEETVFLKGIIKTMNKRQEQKTKEKLLRHK